VHSDGYCLFLNPAMCRILGTARPEEHIGEEYIRWIAPEYHPIIRERVRLQSETGKTAPPVELEYLRRDGTRIAVESTAEAIKYKGLDAHMVFVRDITQRKRTEKDRERLQAQLAQANKMEVVGHLAGSVAHDYNNKLSIILGNAEIALNEVGPTHAIYGELLEIHEATLGACGLTQQLLAFARKQTVVPRSST